MKKTKKASGRTLALLAATLIVLCGGIIGTNAKLTIFSEDYIADFELDHIHVHLIENGTDVCYGKNVITSVHRHDNGQARDQKYHGNLLERNMGYTNTEHYKDAKGYELGTPGTVEPGRTYKEEISAANGENIDQYVRLTIRKYWVDPEGKKATYMDPALIRLDYKDENKNVKAYNTGAWQINPKEHTPESDTYYLTKMLPGAESGKLNPSALLFNQLTIDSSIVDDNHMKQEEEVVDDGDKEITIYTYTYDYDNYTFYIEANVQAIQTHNVNDAIDSLWGVENVSASGGQIHVK